MLATAYCPTPFGCFQIIGSEEGIRSVKLVEKSPCLQVEEEERLELYRDDRIEQFSPNISETDPIECTPTGPRMKRSKCRTKRKKRRQGL